MKLEALTPKQFVSILVIDFFARCSICDDNSNARRWGDGPPVLYKVNVHDIRYEVEPADLVAIATHASTFWLLHYIQPGVFY